MSAETVPHPADDPAVNDGTRPIPCRVHPQPDLWHPERRAPGRESGVRAVRWLCGRCPVQAECLTWAIDTSQQHGIWGGMGQHSRERIRRERAGTAASTPAA